MGLQTPYQALLVVEAATAQQTFVLPQMSPQLTARHNEISASYFAFFVFFI